MMKKELTLFAFFFIQFIVYISLYSSILTGNSKNIIASLWNNSKTSAERSEERVKISKKMTKKYQKKNIYVPSHEYLINNNIAQYSCYKVISKDEYDVINYSIEVLVQFRKKLPKTHYPTRDFIGLLKLSDNEEVIELEPFESPKFYLNSAKKFIFKINPDAIDFNKIVAVAAILKNDFSKTLDLKTFENFFNLEPAENLDISLPYSFIKYQKPALIQSTEPRIPSVSLCVHYTYAIPPQIITWFNQHLSFGVKEIMIYDGLEDGRLKKYLKKHFGTDERITVMPYAFDRDNLCKENNNFNLSEKSSLFLKHSCNHFYHTAFEHKIQYRFYHEQVSSNDCFSVLSKKYEFIGYHDLDEFIYPMNLNYANFYEEQKLFFCENESKKSICSMKPLTNYFNSNILSENHLYNYLISIISKNNSTILNQVRSVYFPHAGVLLPNEIEHSLITQIGSIVKKSNERNFYNQFPFTIRLSLHTFVIELDDIEYIKHLYSSYQSLIPCAYLSYLNKIDKYDKNLVRYLYYATETRERAGKTIHYYKHVKSVFMHYARDFDKPSKLVVASAASGRTLRHYRELPKTMKRNQTGTIRKINIDYEYIFYLLKKFTDFCGEVL
jgi:hypothetical protein